MNSKKINNSTNEFNAAANGPAFLNNEIHEISKKRKDNEMESAFGILLAC